MVWRGHVDNLKILDGFFEEYKDRNLEETQLHSVLCSLSTVSQSPVLNDVVWHVEESSDFTFNLLNRKKEGKDCTTIIFSMYS